MKPVNLGRLHTVLIQSFVATCCDQSWYGGWEHQVLAQLMSHVKSAHPELLPKLEKRGREMARSQNGKGYYDASDKDTGWMKANSEFRQGWMLKALQEAVREHK